DAAAYFYARPAAPVETLREMLTPAVRAAVADVAQRLAAVAWNREALAALLKAVAVEHKLKAGEVMMPVRWLVSGTGHTPAIDAVLALLSRDEACARIASGLAAV
ncbi:MAG: glutamate--tRNA ligase, partial [Burkholderiales bacterium]|nr:glutamate--tRNA ligase [Burkholderiales bacterium]